MVYLLHFICSLILGGGVLTAHYYAKVKWKDVFVKQQYDVTECGRACIR